MYRFKTVADVSSYVRHASSFSPLERFAFLHTPVERCNLQQMGPML